MSSSATKTSDKEHHSSSPKTENLITVKKENLEENNSSEVHLKAQDSETTNQASLINPVKQENVDGKMQNKRKNVETSDDEEDFAGFDKSELKLNDSYLKKLRTESSSESESPNKKGLQIQMRTQVADPAYQVPFKYGWKRELVLRAEPVMSKEKGEVYYITPTGKKLRTRHEIQNHLHDDLTINNFTLVKEAIGAAPEYEIIRSAKYYNFARRSLPESPIAEPVQVLGKRTPKPKLPKGASPPPPSRPTPPKPQVNRLTSSNASASSKTSNKVLSAKENQDTQFAGPSTKTPTQSKSKAKGVCSIQCLPAMGKIPALKCKLCLRMYHPECVQVSAKDWTNFSCENCKAEKSSSQKSNEKKQAKTLHGTSNNRSTRNPPKSHNFEKNPQTIVSCKNNKFIIFESSNADESILDDDQQLKTLKRKLNNVEVNRTTNSSSGGLKVLNDVGKAGPSKNQQKNATVAAAAVNISKQPSPFNFSEHFFENVSLGLDVLLNTLKYLKVQELQRASCVCRLWNLAAQHKSLWKTVRMKNSHVNDWEGFARTLKRNATKHLDLRKMLMTNQEQSWKDFSANIGRIDELEVIDLCRCQSTIVENLFQSNPNLKVINAVSLKDDKVDLTGLTQMVRLEELRLKTTHVSGIQCNLSEMNFVDLNCFENLKHLSLTTVQNLNTLIDTDENAFKHLRNLESLELGFLDTCSDEKLAKNLKSLKNLQRLRLEKGSIDFNVNSVLKAIAISMSELTQLELINCDIKPGFEEAIKKCNKLKKILLIPTYVSQSAATNSMILRGIMGLGSVLDLFIWVVTTELLRVTELYMDQCDNKNDKSSKRSPEKLLSSPLKSNDCIPILKPVPGSDDDVSDEKQNPSTSSDVPQQVQIVSLKTVESILSKYMLPPSKFKLQKIACALTWKQTMQDMP